MSEEQDPRLEISLADKARGLNVLLNWLPRRTTFSAIRTVQEHYLPWTTKTRGWTQLGDHLQFVWSRGILARSNTKVALEGAHLINPEHRYIVVCNHQSYFDIPVMFAVFPISLRFVAKAELRHVPMFGTALENLQHVLIDRSKGKEAYACMRDEAERTGTNVVIFPEGTRTSDGTLGRFKGGAFRMAVESGLPILPVAIDGTYHIMPKWRTWLKTGQMVKVRVAPPVSSAGASPDALRDEVRSILLGMLESGA